LTSCDGTASIEPHPPCAPSKGQPKRNRGWEDRQVIEQRVFGLEETRKEDAQWTPAAVVMRDKDLCIGCPFGAPQ
jgi:hypothetical protein